MAQKGANAATQYDSSPYAMIAWQSHYKQ